MTNIFDFPLGFETNNNTTATYKDVINFYEKIAEFSDLVQCKPFGMTDVGFPLHEVVVSSEGSFTPEEAVANGKAIYFVNNAIHPGEPCGVEATMLWLRDIVNGKLELSKDVVLVIIPFYNIGGGLNRNSTTRTNQNGPEAYGFRGNVQHLDLNRDFVKCDSKNAASFNQLFNKWSPHVQVDNHTSNGADYQYVMTLIATQKDKLAPAVSQLMTESMLPFLYQGMAEREWEMIPYVYSEGSPDKGIYGFMDYGRYSSGYAALHHTISFMPETHMLKPYADRVWSNYAFMQVMLEYVAENVSELVEAKKKAIADYALQRSVAIDWTLDKSKEEQLLFKGYEAKYKPSEVSGMNRLFYDQKEPYEKNVPFWNSYNPSKEVQVPEFYVIPQAYDKVIDRLRWNGVEVETMTEDQVINVEVAYIEDYNDIPAYEGHYLHRNIQVRKEKMSIQYLKGDYIIRTNQKSMRYIMETLEPQAVDGFFAWNFFDGILMQKEHFSPYVFEDLAADILMENPELRNQLDAAKKEDEELAKSGHAQLEWVYRNSPHYEKNHKRFPITKSL